MATNASAAAQETFERIVSSIKECAAYAESKKVLAGLQNHNHTVIAELY
jgi:hypothetical protein